MGKAQGGRSRGEAEENDLGGGQEAHRGGAESTVGEGEEGGVKGKQSGPRLLGVGCLWTCRENLPCLHVIQKVLVGIVGVGKSRNASVFHPRNKRVVREKNVKPDGTGAFTMHG